MPQKNPGLLGRGRGGLTTPDDRQKALEILEEGIAAGARASELMRQFAGDGEGVDGRKGSSRQVAHRLSEEERQRILLTCNEPQYASLQPGQIVPDIADQGIYIGSERSFYRVLHAHGQLHRRGRARLPQEPRPVPRLRATGPNQVWSWDIFYLPTSDKGIWLYLYLVIDVWSRLPGLGQRAGGTRWWPGMWRNARTPNLLLSW